MKLFAKFCLDKSVRITITLTHESYEGLSETSYNDACTNLSVWLDEMVKAIKTIEVGSDNQILKQSHLLQLLIERNSIEIREIYPGSIGLWIRCLTPEAITYLQEIIANGQLEMALQKDLSAIRVQPQQQGLLGCIKNKIALNLQDEHRLEDMTPQSM